MATRGSEKDRVEGEHDNVELSPGENAAFDQISAGFKDPSRQAEEQIRQPVTVGGGDRVYDNHSGYTRRFGGETRRDSNQHAGYTKRDPNRHAGYTKRDLKNAEEGGDGEGKPSKKDRFKRLAATGLLGAEKQGDSSPADSLYTGGSGSSKWGKARGFLQKHRKTAIATGLGAGALLPLLALMMFMLGALKIPHFVENMATWRFVRVTNQYRKSVTNVMGAKAALDSMDDAARAQAVQRYGKYAVFDKVNRLRPNRVLQSLQTADRIQYNYKTTLTGKQKLVSITIAEGQDFRQQTTYKVPSGRFDRLVHPLKTLDQYRTVSAALDQAMKTHDPKIPTVVRSAATKAVIKKAGGSLKGLVASRYLGKNNSAALQAISKEFAAEEKKLDALAERHNQVNNRIQEAFKDNQAVREQLALTRSESSEVFKQMLALTAESPWEEVDRVQSRWQALLAQEKVLVGQFDDLLKEVDNLINEARGNFDEIKKIAQRYDTLREQYVKEGGVLSDRQAKIAIQQEFYERTRDSGGIAGIVSDEGKKVAQEVDEKTQEIVNDPEKLGESVDKGGGVPDEVLDVVEQRTDPGRLSATFQKIVGFANPVYDIAMPVCMMYDGSKIGPESLNAKQNAVMREAFTLLSAADQQKNGNDWNTVMAGALNWKTGDIRDSMAMRKAEGKDPDTTQTPGGQRTTLGTYGEYTIFDALTGGNGGPLNSIADSVCPVATNIWFGVGLGIVNIAVVVFSGGTAGAAEAGATQGAKTAITAGIKKVITKQITGFTVKKGIKAFAKSGRFAKQYGKDVIKWGAITAGATFMARMIVLDKVGSLNDGLETKAAFLDNVDDGAVHIANEANRANYMARPLSNVEIAQNFKREKEQITQWQQEKSTFERYFAITNPQSLLTRVASTTSSLVNRSIFSSLLNSLATLYNPSSLTSRLFADANSQAAFAAGPVNTRDYGNVVWDYSAEEYRLMDQDSYASPPENSKILEDSGKEQEIEDTYRKCFDKTPGQLLADEDIVRDESGDVLNRGACSPQQLGPNNPEYGDLVFRWRLKHNYGNTADLLNGIADPQKGISNAGTASTGIPTGTTQELATRILQSPNIRFQVEPEQRQYMERIAQTGKASWCGGPAVDAKLLGVILALSQKYKIVVGVVVDGHDCNGGFHPKGQAVDLNGVTRLTGGVGTGNSIEDVGNRFSSGEQEILSEFYVYAGQVLAEAGGGGLGQIQCFDKAPQLNPKVTYFNDTCHHIHLDLGKR